MQDKECKTHAKMNNSCWVLAREYGVGTLCDRKRLTTATCTAEMVLDECQPNCAAIDSPVQSLRLERNDWRYLLCGCSQGTLPIYDMHSDGGHVPVAVVKRGRNADSGRHTKGICVADWYFVDNGIFNVGSFGEFGH
jgi:hypothetical protein